MLENAHVHCVCVHIGEKVNLYDNYTDDDDDDDNG